MKVIGLTGGIGTGKSTAAGYLEENGYMIIDADQIGRDITADGSDILPVLNRVFGPEGEFGDGSTEILDSRGSLIRRSLAAVVFSVKERKEKLDEIMFQRIVSDIDDEISEIRSDGNELIRGIIIDAPLLFEAGLDDRCEKIIVVVADEDVRIERVCRRDGATPSEVRDRIRNQISDREKIERSDIVIDNSEDLQHLKAQLDRCIAELG